MGEADMSGEVARSVGLVLKCECGLCGKIYCKLHTVLSYLVCYPVYMFYCNLSCEYGCQLFGVYLSSCLYRGDLRFTCCSMCVLLSYLLYYVCTAGVTLDAELLARSQCSEGPATGHLDTGFSWFPCVYKQMLRWLLCFHVATTCFSCSPPGLKLDLSVTCSI
jgi:hypothetical protein